MAIINHTYGFIFVHIPKTAGSSVTKYLAAYQGEKDLVIGVTQRGNETLNRVRGLGLNKHSTCTEIQNYLGERVFAQYFKFVIIRNPYSRAYSIYKFLKTKYRKWTNSEIMDTFETFEEFIQSDFFQSSGPDRIFNPQSYWLPPSKSAFSISIFNGRLETLEGDLSQLIKLIGLPQVNPEKVLESINVSSGEADWREVINDPLTKKIIQKKFSEDFTRFGYKF
ncbi:MAG: sulfotransferase family protein [Cyclobacteriaceae bacterium]